MVARVYYTIKKLETDFEKLLAGEGLIASLRPEDKAEILAFTDDVKEEILSNSIMWSREVWEAYDRRDGAVIAVWGIGKVPGCRGQMIWCLGTYRIADNWIAFARESRKIVDGWTRRYGLLWNHVSVKNEYAVRWLKWCGAKFDSPMALGRHGEEFMKFRIEGAS